MINYINSLKNQLYVFAAQIKKHIQIQIRYPIDFFGQIFTVIFVGLWIIFFIIALSSTEQGTDSAIGNFTNIAVWGIVVYFLYTTSTWTIGRFVRQEQLTGTLESLWVTPANKVWLLTSAGIGGFIVFLVANVIIVGGFALFADISFNNIGLSLLILFLTILQSIGFGFLYGALVFKIKNAEVISNLVQFSLLIFSAVAFTF